MADDVDLESYVANNSAPLPSLAPSTGSSGDDSLENYVNQKQYGGVGSQIAAGLEGVGQGIAGPLAPGAERLLGIPAEDIRGRAQANPVSHAVGVGAGLTGSLLVPGDTEYSLASQVGNLGEKAAALLPEGAGAIARAGIAGTAQMAALQTSDELTKTITQDPGQTLGSAAINIGLSGIMGGVGGAALGSVSPLWAKAKNIAGVDKLLGDFMTETEALRQARMSAGAATTDHIEDIARPADWFFKPPKPIGSAASSLGSDFEAIPASSGNKSPGVALARWVDERGSQVLAQGVGNAVATTIGAGLGAFVGHPIVGGAIGEKFLGPIFSSLAKPFAESAIDSLAAKATTSYLQDAISGQRVLDSSVSNLFRTGAQVIGNHLIPDQASRDKLQKSLDFASQPQNAINVGGKIGYYLPQHATAAAETTASATNYLNGLKPTQPVNQPLDTQPPVDKAAQDKYNRALDIAQQPLLVLQHAKNGTLLPSDVQTIRTIYPNLHDAMISKITNGLINNKAHGNSIPYSQKVSMNLLMGGNPLDGTMTPVAQQAIINSASPKSQMQAHETKTGQKAPSQGALKQINKVNALYATPLQSRQINKRS